MGFKYRAPSIKIGGTRIRKTKNGYSISGKTLTGGRKTYNTATGKTTKTYRTGIKGLTYQTVSGGKTNKTKPHKKEGRVMDNQYIANSRSQKKVNRWVIILIVLILGILLFGGKAKGDNLVINEQMTKDEVINLIQSRINEMSDKQLIFVEEFKPNDEESGHYRTEFRLRAYNNAAGYSFLYGNTEIDIVIRDDMFNKNVVRIYANRISIDDSCKIISIVSPVLDKNVTQDDINKTIDYIKRWKEANGYYFSDLGLVLLGNEKKGYELMLKMD